MKPKSPKEPPVPEPNQLRIVGVQEGRGWRIVLVESPHCFFYLTEHLVVCLDATKQTSVEKWVLQGCQGVFKPEWMALATKIQGDAVANAQQAVRDAVQGGNECPVCLGSKVTPDDPGKKCQACDGTGRKS